MEYVVIFIIPALMILSIWLVFNQRDAYRKAKESLSLKMFLLTLVIMCVLFLFRSSGEYWDVANKFSWIAVIGMIVSLIALVTMNQVKTKKYASDFDILEQETMYDTLVPLESAYAHRIIKWSSGKPSKMTTANIELDVVDINKELTPHLKKEIIDIVGGVNKQFYEYTLHKIDPKKEKLDIVESSLSKFYKGIMQAAQKNLKHFDSPISFSDAMKKNDYVIEYAILYILESAKALKNTPVGNLGSLVESPQDEHMLGACGSLGFTSVGRYGIALYVGYKLFWHAKKMEEKKSGS